MRIGTIESVFLGLQLEDGIALETVLTLCKGQKELRGKGYIDLSFSTERMVKDLSDQFSVVKMGLKLYRDEKLQVLTLGKLESVGISWKLLEFRSFLIKKMMKLRKWVLCGLRTRI